MKTPASFCGEMPARAIWVCVPSPQSNSHHSPSPTTASALTLRCSVGLPELVPSGMIFITKREYGKDGNNGTVRNEFTRKLPSVPLFPSFPYSLRASRLSLTPLPAKHPFTRIVPPVQDNFVVSVKVKALMPLNVQISEERLVPSREGKDGHRGGDADVDADHAAIDVAREGARRAAVTGKDDRAVAVRR